MGFRRDYSDGIGPRMTRIGTDQGSAFVKEQEVDRDMGGSMALAIFLFPLSLTLSPKNRPAFNV
jgi:hypothetical protein